MNMKPALAILAAGCQTVTVKVACIETAWRGQVLTSSATNQITNTTAGGGAPTFPLLNGAD